MKYQQILATGAMTLAGALSLAGLNVYAVDTEPASPSYDNITTIADLKTCLEATTNDTCKLGDDIVPTTSSNIETKTGTEKILDLNGHIIKKTADDTSISITSSGKLLTIQDSEGDGAMYGSIIVTSGDLTIKGGLFHNYIHTAISATEGLKIRIENGTFNGGVSVSKNNSLEIINGTFNYDVSASENSTLVITDAKVNQGTVRVTDNASGTINGGTYNGSVSSFSVGAAGKGKITGGNFKKTVFCGSDNSSLEITGGNFVDLNCISYHPGSKLTISGGTFTSGFSIGIETLEITGGKFLNGSLEGGGWLSLILEHPEEQKFSITGGEFENTQDEYGKLMAINTIEKPTKASIEELFKGGNVLEGSWIELGTDDTGGGYWSYIKKAKVDGEESDIKIPDTGASTMNEDNMDAASIATLIASALCGASALMISVYLSFHKKVSFKK